MLAAARIAFALTFASFVVAAPSRPVARSLFGDVYDVEAHRGGRGETIENTLPAFAQSLIEGIHTLEMDNGITKDGVVVVWHDEQIVAEKCVDTKPVAPNDPLFPYVGKYIANLTFAQLSTLDCGSERLASFPIQITIPKTRIPSQKQVFDMVACADPLRLVHWNIESKVNPGDTNITVSAAEFVKRQREVFSQTPYYKKKQIVYQSFDWRTIRDMAKIDKYIINSALVDSSTLFNQNGSWPWLANLNIDSFPGSTLQEKVVYAAQSIGSQIVSPGAYDGFVTKGMVDTAHKLKLDVVPWTVNNLTLAQELYDMGVDGIISDYPYQLRRWAKHGGLKVGTPFSETIVNACLKKYQ